MAWEQPQNPFNNFHRKHVTIEERLVLLQLGTIQRFRDHLFEAARPSPGSLASANSGGIVPAPLPALPVVGLTGGTGRCISPTGTVPDAPCLRHYAKDKKIHR